MGKLNENDLQIIKDNYGKIKNHELIEMLSVKHISESTLYNYLKRLNIDTSAHKWTDEDDLYLINNYPKGNMKEILKHLKTTKIKLINRTQKLGLVRVSTKGTRWLKDEDDIILKNWKDMEDFQIEKLIKNRTSRAIKYRRGELGLVRDSYGIGNLVTSENDDFCHSIGECKLIDYVFNLGFDYRKDVSYNELILGDKSNRTCDLCIYINNTIYAIEYFGLYRKTPRNKMETNYVERMAYKYESFRSKKNDGVIFMALYPDDIDKNNSKRMKKIINNLYEKEK